MADQHGTQLLDLVEQVRQLTTEAKSADDTAEAGDVQKRLAEVPLTQATQLTRAFTQYFLLANAAEQVYRVRALSQRPTDESWVPRTRSEEHTSELQSRGHLVCRLLLEKKNKISTAL